jgi:hypothetical protein
MFVEVKIWHGEHLLADDHYKLLGGEANRKIALSDPGIDDSRNALLWSPERPTLLDAEVTCAAATRWSTASSPTRRCARSRSTATA